MNKRDLIIYWVVTGLLTLEVAMSAGMYFFKHEMVKEVMTGLGFPTYIIYPLAIAKLLGITAILTKKSELLKEWAYAGFTFVFLLATSAHINANDGEFAAPAIALVILWVSYVYGRKLEAGKKVEVN
jgi:spore maturation protein SpmB